MSRRAAFTALAALMLVVALVPPAPAEGHADDGDGCAWEEVDGLGPVCDAGNGLWKVLHSDGSVGYTHGLDPVWPDEDSDGGPGTAAGPVPPVCESDLANGYYAVVIYARAHDDSDRYATMQPQIVDLVEDMNGKLREEAGEFGTTIDYKVECDGGGTVKVYNEALPTDKALATFSSIVGDLRAKGYDSGQRKYWVWYDDTGACACSGTGHIYNDDSASTSNLNNGNGVSLFAVTFGYMSLRTFMHESGHTMGAVQKSAPHSTDPGGSHPNGWHCTDGQDIMCYNDGAPQGSSYTTGICTDREHYDCNHDDYFHPNPPPGSYLDTHWNIGHSRNRFLAFGGGNAQPGVPSVSCSPSPSQRSEAVTCTFSSSDDSAGVYYTVDWADGGPTTRVPATGTVTPGTTQSASHAWGDIGPFTVSVTATDTDSTTSAAGTFAHEVVNAAPSRPTVACAPDPALRSDTVTCTFSSADDSPGVSYEIEWEDGSPNTLVPESGTVTPGTTQSASHQYEFLGEYTVVVYVTDSDGADGLAGTYILDIVNQGPTMTSLACSPDPAGRDETVTCSFSGTDPDSGGVSYKIDWGDGVSWRVPLSGTVASGTSRTASHSYDASGTFTIKVRVTDADGASSTWLAESQQVTDLAPSMVALSCSPNPSGIGSSATCSFRADDDGSGVSYTVDWGDGSPTTRVPSSGTVAPSVTRSASHAWSPSGSYTVTVYATDDAGQSSTTRTITQVVENARPTVVSLSCAPSPSEPSQSVTCTFKANDDSSGLWYEVDWGDGSATTRVPASGTVSPGVERSASHTWVAEGDHTVRVTATDNDPSPRSHAKSLVHTVEVPCVLHRTGTLLAGLGGADVEGVSAIDEADIPPSCWGEQFILTGTFPWDFDLCWYEGAVEKRCHSAGRVEIGNIPEGADRARILFRQGVAAEYELTAGSA